MSGLPGQATRGEGQQPLTPTEEIVAGAWQRVLGAKALRGDDFFQLGGDSLGASQVSSQLRVIFRASVDLGLIFEHPILVEYAAAIDRIRQQAEGLNADEMVVIDRSDRVPLSFLQENRLLRDARALANGLRGTPDLVSLAIQVEGPVDDGREQLICSARLRDLFRQLPGCRLVNQYGPTETHALTQYSLPWSPDEWPEFPPIGSPLPNCTILVASGTAKNAGELLAAGRPVGLGYHNRPELTAERFVDVQLGRHLARAYRTGDNVRVAPDGLEFLGRLDDQVKIRGYRVELGEVDAALLRADGVAEACACVVRSPSGHNRLEAVVVADREFSQHALDHCIGELPDYMRPARIHFFDEIGRTPSGKADRRGLAEMLAGPERPVKAADPERDPGLSLVLSVLAEVAGHPVDGSEPMSDLVSDSLTAALVAARIRARSTYAVTPGDILGAAHLTSLAELVSGSGESASTHAPEPATISAGQEGLLVQHHVSNVPERLNIAVSIELAGDLRLDRLVGAIRGIVKRHPALRTQFTMGPAGFESAIASTETDISVIRAEDNAVGIVAAELIAADSAKPFDLTTGALTRWAVVTGQSRHCLVGMLHHVACDGVSLNVIGKELAEFYSNGPATRTVPEPARTVTGGRRGSVLAGHWRRRLEGAWDASAALGGRGKPTALRRTTIPLLLEDIVSIARYARSSGVTGFSVVLAAMAVALADFWNNSDITIAVPVTQRTRAEERSVGYYLNTVLMTYRTAVVSSATARQIRDCFAAVLNNALVIIDQPP